MEQLNIDNLLKRINLDPENARAALAIYNVVVESIKHLPNFFQREQRPERPNVPVVENTNQIQVHEQNLMRLIELLESYDSPCAEFMRNFPVWEPTRKENCELLKYTAEYLQYDHRACTIASVTGNSVGVVGGAAAISGLIFPPLGVAVGVGGAIVAGVGGLTSLCSSIADGCRIKKHMKKTLKICEKDQDSSKLLGKWLRHSVELEKAMAELIGFSIWQKMWENFKSFIGVRDLWSRKFSLLTLSVKACVAFFPPDHALFITLGVDAFAAILTTLIAMILFHRQTQSALQCYMLALGALRVIDSSVEISMVIAEGVLGAGAFGAKFGAAGGKAFASRAAAGAFAAVGVALDVTMIVLNSIELAKTEMCAEAKRILKLYQLLEEERRVLNDVYQAMLVH